MTNEKMPDKSTTESDKESKTQSESATQVRDAEGVMAKNKELLGEIAGLKKKLSSFESKSDKEKEDKLKEEGKLKELLEKKEGESKTLRERIRRAELKAATRKFGLVDDDYIDILAKSVEFDENDQPTNLDEVFTTLKEKKPYLFAQPEPEPKPGTNNTGASWKGGHVFTIQDLQTMTPEERNKNRAEIDRQFAAGLLK